MGKAELLSKLQDRIYDIEGSRMGEETVCGPTPSEPSFSEILSMERMEQDALDRIVRLVSTRDRSEKELRNRLSNEGFEHDEVSLALDRAKACNLVNDERFAHSRIRGLVSKGKGIIGIRRDLEQYGVKTEKLKGWPEEFLPNGTDGELNRALLLLSRKPSRSKNQFNGNYSKLIRYGYSSDVALKATKRFMDDNCNGHNS